MMGGAASFFFHGSAYMSEEFDGSGASDVQQKLGASFSEVPMPAARQERDGVADQQRGPTMFPPSEIAMSQADGDA